MLLSYQADAKGEIGLTSRIAPKLQFFYRSRASSPLRRG